MSVIEEVKQKTDIVEIVGQYTKLNKSRTKTLRVYALFTVKSTARSLFILMNKDGIALVPVMKAETFFLS